MARKEKRMAVSPTGMRRVTVGVAFGLVAIGIVFSIGTGTLSSFGWDYVAAVCPLGALEAVFGTWSFAPRLLIALAAVVLITLIVGRAFCAWVCPVPPLTRFFKSKRRKDADEAERRDAGRAARANYCNGEKPSRGKISFDSRHVVLCGSLGTAAIFGFPVFCIICPIGLVFAIVVGLVNLIGFNEPSWSLLLFVAILAFEVIFLRKWCSKFCPVGALLSLISRANRTFRPQIDSEKCLRHQAQDLCGACASVCPELIDPCGDRGLVPVDECTRCGRCLEACPKAAISFPLLPPHAASAKSVELGLCEAGNAASVAEADAD